MENNEEPDIAALAAEVGDSLFAKAGPEDSGNTESAPASAPEPVFAPPDESSNLPKAWKKEMEAHWKTLPPDVRKYVYSREADVSRGIQQYHQGYTRWDAVTKPYQQLFSQDPNFDPVPVLQGLMQTHVVLSNPNVPIAQKRAFLLEAAKSYQIDMAEQAGQPAASIPDISNHPDFLRMQKQLNGVTSVVQTSQQQQYAALVAQQTQAVDKFSTENPYFNEVAGDIHRLIRTGAAADLPTAYNMAVWSNTEIRAKLLADQQAAGGKARRVAQPVNIESSGTANVRNGKKSNSIDDTIATVLAKYTTQH